ncbi:MAG: hypothetical protein R3B45_03025 [Bdellovibrionota bacterium]
MNSFLGIYKEILAVFSKIIIFLLSRTQNLLNLLLKPLLQFVLVISIFHSFCGQIFADDRPDAKENSSNSSPADEVNKKLSSGNNIEDEQRGNSVSHKTPQDAISRPRIYLLESIELVGTSRLSIEQLASNLGLRAGIPMDDDFVMDTRAKLLSLGLFKSVILSLRKGSEKGRAHLVFSVEDDDGVLGDWALGGSLGVVQSEAQVKSVSQNVSPLGYRIELIGRNFFNAQHRASSFLDIDGKGVVREAKLAYGLPRFAAEDTQFDTEVSVVDVNQRYLNVLGFGGHAQGLWSSSSFGLGKFRYGGAMYVNSGSRFRLPGFPRSVAGPQISYGYETRLLSFIPSPGYSAEASLLVSPIELDRSIAQLNLAKTLPIGESRLSFLINSLGIAGGGYGLRSEVRYDLPIVITAMREEKINFYSRFRGGVDRIEGTNLLGSAAIFGLRYYSSGFIAEFALQVTRLPQQLNPKPLIDQSPLEEGL